MLLWFTWLHASDQRWSLRWSQTKRAHRLHGGARLKLRIMPPCKSDFPSTSLAKVCTKLQKSALVYHGIQHSVITLKLTSHIGENPCQLSNSPISVSTVQPLLEQQQLYVGTLKHACRWMWGHIAVTHFHIFRGLMRCKQAEKFVGEAL